jgi:hypothetical protein
MAHRRQVERVRGLIQFAAHEQEGKDEGAHMQQAQGAGP